MTRQTDQSWKHRAPFIALALITIGLSSWGLFHLFVDFAGMPRWMAPFAVGGLDLVAVVLGAFALTVSGDGDSPGPWNALLLGFMALAAYVQYAHGQLANWPQILGVTMAAFPVATVLLFEGQLRRAARLTGRARGTVAPPRRTVPLLVWIHFPRRAWHATRQAILAQGHLDGPAAKSVRLRRSELNRAKAIEPAPNKETRNGHDRPQTVAAAVRVKPDKDAVAAAIRDAKALHGTDLEAVLAAANKVYPVSRETVRTNLRRERQRMNGHEVHA